MDELVINVIITVIILIEVILDLSPLCFGINSDLKHPYKNDLVDNGHFNDSSNGVISVQSFSIIIIIERILIKKKFTQEYRYCCLLYSTTIRNRDILRVEYTL